jgi:hypothetical protein
MANLDKHNDQEAWLAWAIEFVRRGLHPMGDIEIHGPHAPPGDFMWGKAFCKDILDGRYHEVEFRTQRCRSIWDISDSEENRKRILVTM